MSGFFCPPTKEPFFFFRGRGIIRCLQIKYQPPTNGVDHRPDSLLRRQCVQRQKHVTAGVGILTEASRIIKFVECAGNVSVPNNGNWKYQLPNSPRRFRRGPAEETHLPVRQAVLPAAARRTFGQRYTEGSRRKQQKGRKKCRNTGKPRRETDRLLCGPVKIRRCTEDKSPPRSGEPDWYAKPGRFSWRQSSSCQLFLYIESIPRKNGFFKTNLQCGHVVI